MAAHTLERIKKHDFEGLKKTTSDGGGLWLEISKTGSRQWVFRFQWKAPGEAKAKGKVYWIGTTDDYDLDEARYEAMRLRRQVRQKINPIEARRAASARNLGETLGQLAVRMAPTQAPKSDKDPLTGVWMRDMTKKLAPLAGMLPADIEPRHVVDTIQPYWIGRNPTARRLLNRLTVLLQAAKVDGLITDERWINPAIYKGHLEHMLKKLKRRKKKHFEALEYEALPAFLVRVRTAKKRQMSALCFEWTILTACRVGEACKARWSEIDLRALTWTIPVEHLKTEDEDDEASEPHVVPLTLAMVRVLQQARRGRRTTAADALIFPNARSRQLSGEYIPNSIWQFLQQFKLINAKGKRVTVHGFRTTFAEWAKLSGYSRELVDFSLAHEVGDETSAAYQRSTLLPLRRPLMEAWSRYCTKPPEANTPDLRLAA